MLPTVHIQQAVHILQQAGPLTVFVFYVIAALASACKLETLSFEHPKNLRHAVLSVMALVAVTHICEAGLIMSQIFSQSLLATTDSNVYALSSILLWTFLAGTLAQSPNQRWYPYYGAWMIALVVEVGLFATYMAYLYPTTATEKAQVLLHPVRMILIAILPLLIFGSSTLRIWPRATDEEASPLLRRVQEASEASHASSSTSQYGSTVTDGSQVTLTSDGDTAEAKQAKKDREDRERVEKRLKEAGNWWAYAKTFLIFLPYLWPSKKSLLQVNMMAVGMCLVIIRVLNVLVPTQLGVVIDALGHCDAHRTFVQLALYSLYVWLDSSAGIHAFKSWLWLPVEINALLSLDTASYNHIMELSGDFHDSKQSGELYTAMEQGKSVIRLLETLLYDVIPMLVDLLVACFYFYWLFDAYMQLIVTTTIITYLWVSMYMTTKQTGMRRTYAATMRKKYQVLYDTMGGWRTVVYFNRMKYSQNSYYTSTALQMEARRRSDVFSFFAYGIQTIVIDIGLLSACFLAVYQVLYHQQTVGRFVALMTYWGNFTSPLSTISFAHRQLFSSLVDAEQLLQLFRMKPTVVDGSGTLCVSHGQVDFEHVSFSYDGKKEIIQDLSFNVRPGQTIALIGETGGGKSTLLKLLFRFYDTTQGFIHVDGQNIRDVTLESLRECIGVVPQDPSLFNDTILANLRFARLDATDEEIVDACKAASIHDKILTFTDQYMSKVGEHGVRLSGGELQRVAIARAILKQPKIILLDEATSSVDIETEGRIQAALEKLTKDRTTFVVAHRLSTIKHADLILVIKDGRILEKGAPAELFKAKGKYYKLWSKQMGIIDAISGDQEVLSIADSGSEPKDIQVMKSTRKIFGASVDPRSEKRSTPSRYDSSKEAESKGNHDEGLSGLPGQTKFELSTPKRPGTSRDHSAHQSEIRPTSSRSAHANPSRASGPIEKKRFRPEAPEFFPSYQRSTESSQSLLGSHEHSFSAQDQTISAHDHSHDPIIDKSLEKKPKSRKRKPKQGSSALSLPISSDSSEPSRVGKTSTEDLSTGVDDGHAVKAKQPVHSRRYLAKSEPAAQSSLQSGHDGTSELDGAPLESNEIRPTIGHHRRVTAPSDPRSGAMAPNGAKYGSRRRRQRHWRVKNREVSGTSGHSSNTQSSGNGGWTSDTPFVGTPTAPFTSPTKGVTPANELAGSAPKGGVRFVQGV